MTESSTASGKTSMGQIFTQPEGSSGGAWEGEDSVTDERALSIWNLWHMPHCCLLKRHGIYWGLQLWDGLRQISHFIINPIDARFIWHLGVCRNFELKKWKRHKREILNRGIIGSCRTDKERGLGQKDTGSTSTISPHSTLRFHGNWLELRSSVGERGGDKNTLK